MAVQDVEEEETQEGQEGEERGRGRRLSHLPPEVEELRALQPDEIRHMGPVVEELAERFAHKLRVANILNAYRSIIEFDMTGAVTARANVSAGAVMEVHELFGRLVRFDVAKALLNQYCAKWPSVQSLAVTNAMIPEGVKPLDDKFRDDRKAEVQVAPHPGATSTFVVFAGRRHGFGVRINFLHHCCLAPNKVNVIYVRDFSETLYLQGIRSLGATPAATAAKLKEMLASLGTERTICMGNSAGVFGSWYYGALLPANHVLNFSGPSSIDLGLQRPAKAHYYDSLRELQESGVAGNVDIRAMYQALPETTAQIFYANDHPFDRAQAEHMDGLPNVTLEPVYDFSEHFVIGELVQQGRFMKVLAQAAYPRKRRERLARANR